MKKLVILLPLLLLFSCSIQKRKYQNGFYVDWDHKKNSMANSSVEKDKSGKQHRKTQIIKEIELSSGDRTEATEASLRTNALLFKKESSRFKHLPDSFDVIFFRDGSEIRAKVEEVGVSEIKYKRCDSKEGPIYVVRKSDIFMIKYVNGFKEIIESTSELNKNSNTNIYKTNKEPPAVHSLAPISFILGCINFFLGFVIVINEANNYAVNAAFNNSYQPSLTIFLPFILAILTIILGAIAVNKIKIEPDKYYGKGLAIGGIVLGIIIALISLLVIASF